MLRLLRRDRAFYLSLIRLAGPMVLQNLINSSMGFIDTVFVGSLGQTTLGGLTLANSPFFVMILMVFGLQSGGSVLISQYWGKGDRGAINRIVGINWMFAVGLITIASTAITIFPEAIFGLMTNDDAMRDIAVRYGRIVALSCIMDAFVTIYIGMLRSCENPRFGMFVSLIGMAANSTFNYIFIFGKLGIPAMGVEGAALGTVLARVVTLSFTLCHIFFAKNSPIRLKLSLVLRPGLIIVRDFLKYSTPVMLNELLWSLGVSLYMVVYGHMQNSSDIVAAYSLAGNLERLVMVVAFAIANASAVFVGKAIGSGSHPDEVYALGRTFALLSFIIGVISGALLIGILFGVGLPFLLPYFQLTDGAVRAAVIMMLIMGASLGARSFNCTMVVGILRGGGDVKFGMILDTLSLYCWALPTCAIAGLVFHLDILWVYLLIISEEPIKMLAGWLRFRSKKWISNVTRNLETA